MAYAGATGPTKEEMARVLHFSGDARAVAASFAALSADLTALVAESEGRVKAMQKFGGGGEPLQINVANRLFGQGGYPFQKPFLELMDTSFGAPLEIMDFIKAPERERQKINAWVAKQTRDRIRVLIPPRVIDADTRLVLVNAVHLKAAWAEKFAEEPKAPFFVNASERIERTGLVRQDDFRYTRIPGGTAVAVPYADGGLQFVLCVPDARDGLAAMEKSLTPKVLQEIARAEIQLVDLHFPPFKLDPGRVLLSNELTAMGMPRAFDQPSGTADFSGIAPRRPDDYLFISEVIHQAFVAVDKHGTEAAAATAVVIPRATAALPDPKKPIEVRIDRPFAFAIQHAATGACLFLGRLTDPR